MTIGTLEIIKDIQKKSGKNSFGEVRKTEKGETK